MTATKLRFFTNKQAISLITIETLTGGFRILSKLRNAIPEMKHVALYSDLTRAINSISNPRLTRSAGTK
jgi:hypothetical protein